MFNGEKLLGGLIRNAIGNSIGGSSMGVPHRSRRRSYSRSGTGALERAIGMGIVGLAISAYEHYTQKGQPQAVPNPPPVPGATGMPAPTMPPQSMPPPPPLKGATPPPAPSTPALDQTATLLIRAMFAAAAADGAIDETERRSILDHMSAGGLTSEEKTFLEQQMAHPLTLDDVIHEARRSGFSEDLRHQIFFVSMLSIAVDTPQEAQYMEGLRQALAISPEKAKEIAAQFETAS